MASEEYATTFALLMTLDYTDGFCRTCESPTQCARLGASAGEQTPACFRKALWMAEDDLHKIFAYLKTVPPKGAESKNQQKAGA
jgi:hypothetical protein